MLSRRALREQELIAPPFRRGDERRAGTTNLIKKLIEDLGLPDPGERPAKAELARVVRKSVPLENGSGGCDVKSTALSRWLSAE